MKKILVLIVLFMSMFIGVHYNKVSAYHCYYKGQEVAGKIWGTGFKKGTLDLKIENGTVSAVNFTDWGWSLLVGGAVSGHISPSVPLEYAGFVTHLDHERDGKAYVKPVRRIDTQELSNQLKKEKYCPSDITISRVSCKSGVYSADTGILPSWAEHYRDAQNTTVAMTYHFNADVWDNFYLDENNYLFFVDRNRFKDQMFTATTVLDWLVSIPDAVAGVSVKQCMFESKEANVSEVWYLDTKKSQKPGKTFAFTCDRLEDSFKYDKKSLTKLYNAYSKCKDKNKNNKSICSNKKSAYEHKLLKVRTWCKSVIETRQHNSGCLQGCIKLNEKLYKMKCIKKKNGKNVDTCTNSDGQCNLSDGIVAFAYNILKWTKYIAPVLVIVLGILDFIKALVAQDDDAMKKAQGKFIKRLVAAVLLFLLPLIIDYVLNVFGLYDKSCDVTDIFK